MLSYIPRSFSRRRWIPSREWRARWAAERPADRAGSEPDQRTRPASSGHSPTIRSPVSDAPAPTATRRRRTPPRTPGTEFGDERDSAAVRGGLAAATGGRTGRRCRWTPEVLDLEPTHRRRTNYRRLVDTSKSTRWTQKQSLAALVNYFTYQ